MNYTKFIDKHKGENCFILAAGPSLYDCMQSSLFCELKKHGIIVTVNSSIMSCCDIDKNFIWISNDHLCVNWSWFSMVRNSKCIKIVRNSWLKYKDDIKGFYIFSPRKTPENEIDFDDDGLCYCSSVPTSLDFSIKCGFKKIFLLGVDQCEDKKTKYNHFWQFFPRKDWPKQLRPAQGDWASQKKVFKYNDMAYKALKRFAEYKNCKIYNCNSESKVEVFEKIKFEDIEKYL